MIGHPRLDPALACELSMRERDALMTGNDWAIMLDRYFEQTLPREESSDVPKLTPEPSFGTSMTQESE